MNQLTQQLDCSVCGHALPARMYFQAESGQQVPVCKFCIFGIGPRPQPQRKRSATPSPRHRGRKLPQGDEPAESAARALGRVPTAPADTHSFTAQLRASASRARAYGYTAPERVTNRECQAKLVAQAGRCYYCGREMGPPTIDHVVPLSEGGRHSIDNIVLACHQCNSRKHVKDAAEFYLGVLKNGA